jgi:hypothetical protein
VGGVGDEHRAGQAGFSAPVNVDRPALGGTA